MDACKMEQKPKNNKRIYVIETIIIGIIILLAVFFFLRFIAQRNIVMGDSMYPALHNKDNIIVSKIHYKTNEIKRFDIVVFPYTDKNEKTTNYIKRVIGLPGENIEINNGKIYITNSSGRFELEDKYGYYENNIKMQGYQASEPVIIGDDEYFVLGDNRNNSKDSRQIGCIKKEDIIGKGIFVFFPFTRIGKCK